MNTETNTGDSPKHMILLGDHQLQLPDGLTVADWTVEKVRWQNPRIRTFLGCIRLLGGVLESNYAILHCSPERLHEILRKVCRVGELIRTEIAPLLATPSRFPALEDARQRAELSLEMLSGSVLSDLEEFTDEVPPEGDKRGTSPEGDKRGTSPEGDQRGTSPEGDQRTATPEGDQREAPPEGDQRRSASRRLLKARKLLCVSIGKMHGFLQDAFGGLMANDPRSFHDADYFLSRRFPQDLEEAEWLHATVNRLAQFLEKMNPERARRLSVLAAEVAREESVPVGRPWGEAQEFLKELIDVLTPKLKEVLALRGIRFYEMEILDRYAVEIPTQCRILMELQTTSRQAIDQMKGAFAGGSLAEREKSVRDLESCHATFSARLVALMHDVDTELQDLYAFVPIWLDGINKRRALLLKSHFEKKPGEEADLP